jgi:hypothetical protein
VSGRLGTIATLVLGFAALIAGTLAGWNAGLLDALVTPPTIVRATLIAVSSVVGVALLAGAASRIGDAGRREHPERDLAGMIRGVRLAFLAVAAFAAAGGWALGHALPLVVALIIAAVDVVETSFLLLVVTFRGDGRDEGGR